jgi:hypothetical protein
MSTTKIDYKRELRDLYLPGRAPCLVDVPEMAFLMIDGHGDPNTATAYRDAIEALYGVAYAVKFAVKRGLSALDYSVMPLESLWWSDDMRSFAAGDKSRWSWTAMIMQPEPATEEIVLTAIQQAGVKKSLPALAMIRYEHFAEGAAAQVMYVGPYKDEGPTIQALHAFIAEQGCKPVRKHHEIYLGDPRRSAPDKLRTVIRQPVAPR